jgi:outer membrane receptor protein involved in Fe transport
MQRTDLRGDLKLLNIKIDKSFQNVLPAVRFNYDFSNTKHLRFDYETSMQEPTIQQLQPVVDNSDPLNLSVGNPSLRPAYVQRWRTNFTTFDPATFMSFFAFADIDYITNAITSAQSINQDLIRTTKPVNVDHNLNINTNASFGFPIQKLESRFNFGIDYRHQQSVNLLNEVPNEINQRTAGGNVRYTYRYKEIFDATLSADVDQQRTTYKFNQADQMFINKTYSAEANLKFLKNYSLNANFDYLAYNSKTTNFKQTIPLLDLSVSRFVLKGNAGELKFSVNNMLNKALGINQTATSNYLQRETTNSLGRYFMVSFTYALNRQLNPMGAQRGGMIRIMR